MIQQFSRDISSTVRRLSESYSVIILTGPRQTGKTTALRAIAEAGRDYVSLDDPMERSLAKNDPRGFLLAHPAPVLIDEVQYAPELFSFIKMAVDGGAAPGAYWLTGSQAFSMMQLARESLAGRAAILHMSTLSAHEMRGSGPLSEFQVSLEALLARQAGLQPESTGEIFQRIWKGGLPGYVSGRYPDREVFFSSYLQTYIDRDLRDIAPGVNGLRFLEFVRAAACRCGDVLNTAALARDVGVSVPTIGRWLDVLERSDIIHYLHPYSNNLLKRTIKSPKLYFFDTGLVAYLTGFSTPEALKGGMLAGALLENYVVNEIRKSFRNLGHDCFLWYYRDLEQSEVDLVLERDGLLHPIEIKKTASPVRSMAKSFSKLRQGSTPVGEGAIVCSAPKLGGLDEGLLVVPVWLL